jgi:hypothetical protein
VLETRETLAVTAPDCSVSSKGDLPIMAKKPRTGADESRPKAPTRSTPELNIENALLEIMKTAPATAAYTMQHLQASLKARFKKVYSRDAVNKALASLQRKNKD